MSESENLELAREFTEEVWGGGNLEVIDDYLADDFKMGLTVPGMGTDREAYKQLAGMLQSAFPDLETSIDDTFASGNRVVQRWTASGTHEGELFGAPATGKPASFAGISIYEIEDGKIQQDWTVSDMLGMMQQLGLAQQPTA